MFVFNVKVNKTKLTKILFGILAIIIVILFIFAVVRIYTEANNDTCIKQEDIIELDNANYTNVLKEVHDNLYKYIGKKIKFSGYIYRVPDFTESQFVLARDMIISSNLKTLVVGFLCDSIDAKKFETNTWIEITGTIEKGTYHEAVPLINVTKIESISKPEDAYVYPPDESFVPTVNLY